MAKLIILPLLTMIISLVVSIHCEDNASFEDYHHDLVDGGMKLKVVQFSCYAQDIDFGAGKSEYEVARSPIITHISNTWFGQVKVVDIKLTAHEDANSREVGRLEGLITSADMTDVGLHRNLNFYFTDGEYKGSSLCILGRDAEISPQEYAVIGGTGKFRFAKGYAIATFEGYDWGTRDNVMQYTFHLSYYEFDETNPAGAPLK